MCAVLVHLLEFVIVAVHSQIKTVHLMDGSEKAALFTCRLELSPDRTISTRHTQTSDNTWLTSLGQLCAKPEQRARD